MKFGLHPQDGVLISDTDPSVEVGVNARTLRLFGSVEYLADYRTLSFARPTQDSIIDVLKSVCAASDLKAAIHRLTECVGAYLVVIEQQGRVTHLYKSDDAAFTVYYTPTDAGIILSSSFSQVLAARESLGLSENDLNAFLQGGKTRPYHTLFDQVWQLAPYSLYQVDDNDLKLIAHAFPGFHTVGRQHFQYTFDDFFKALSAYKAHFPSFTVAYSGGIDSRILADLYKDKISELITITLAPPFESPPRQAEHEMALKAASHWKLPHVNVVVDGLDEARLLPFMEDYIISAPNSAYPAVHFYALAEAATSPIILNGQAADNMWDWGYHQLYFSSRAQSTSGTYIFNMLKGTLALLWRDAHLYANLRTFVKAIIRNFIARYAMVRSFHHLYGYPFIKFKRRLGPEFDNLRSHPYKMFVIARYIDYVVWGETVSWAISARYFNKRGYNVFINPLALHVNSHVRREHFFDMKKPLRTFLPQFQPVYPEFDSSWPHIVSAPMYHHVTPEDLKQDILDPHLKAMVERVQPKPQNRLYAGLYRTHLYHVLKLAASMRTNNQVI